MRAPARRPPLGPIGPSSLPPVPRAGSRPQAGPRPLPGGRPRSWAGRGNRGAEGCKGSGRRSSPDPAEQRHGPTWSGARWSRGRVREGRGARPPPEPVRAAAAAGNASGLGQGGAGGARPGDLWDPGSGFPFDPASPLHLRGGGPFGCTSQFYHSSFRALSSHLRNSGGSEASWSPFSRGRQKPRDWRPGAASLPDVQSSLVIF